MRVLMSADTVGGVFTYAVDLVEGLRRSGVETVLVTFGRRMSPEQRRRVAAAGVIEVHETALALEWMEDPWRDVAAAGELLVELERQVRPDVIHLNAFAHGGAPFTVPVVVAGHSCVCSWWQAVHRREPPPEWDRYRAVVRHGLSGADAVVAPSATMLAALERWYGPFGGRVHMIHNGTGYGGPGTAPVKEPYVLAAGRMWDEAKNVATLVRAAERPELRGRLRVAGEGGTPGAAGDVLWLGGLSAVELSRVRRRAAVYAAPARYEPFGLGPLEAARDRCALVLGDIPSLREIWQDRAVYVDPDDDERLAAVLSGLLADPDRAAAQGERAYRHAARYGAHRMAAAYERLYRRLADGGGRRRRPADMTVAA